MSYKYLMLYFCLLMILGIVLQRLWIELFSRFKWGETPKSYGPKRHVVLKAGIPTMGGVIFIALSLIALTFVSNDKSSIIEVHFMVVALWGGCRRVNG